MKLTATVLSLFVSELVAQEDGVEEVVVATMDCFDGLNGGCSHYCDAAANMCDCPTCWTLGEDTMTCQPSAEMVSITCGHEGMTVNIDECVYGDGTDTLTVGFSDDEACQSTELDGVLTVTTSLDGCGVAHETVDEAIVFTNTVTTITRVSPAGIVFASDVNFDVECSFNTAVTGLDAATVVSAPEASGGTSGTGEFAFVASYYTDMAFSNLSDETDTIVVGESLKFGIHPTIQVAGVRFYVNECDVTDAGENSFLVWENMCPAFLVLDSSPFISSEMFEMTYKSFQFENEEAVTSEMTITCGLTVCLEGDCPEEPTCE